NPYSIYLGDSIYHEFQQILEQHYPFGQIAIITSKPIFNLHGNKILKQLESKYQVLTLFVPDGEGAKSYEQLQALHTQLLENKFERSGLILAFGGGVIGDLAGFTAATFLRGINFIQVPTTLLAQVDSSIGGKVGINHPMGKNLVGAFKQPLFVFCDTSVLQTLPDAEIRCGMGEVVKYGFVLNEQLFNYLQDNIEPALRKDRDILYKLVKISAAEKANIVMQDEKEKNLRMVLNFGHTFGHALEADFKFGEMKHGEAVILGMKCAMQYALDQNMLDNGIFHKGIDLLNRIPIQYDPAMIELPKLVERMTIDKKVKDGRIRLVLSPDIGKYRFEFADDLHALEKAFRILV
ncbi:MAG TPA: 3-dehydroquinate synthase, partial [Caldithrix sp.]|nr:3-dehydroquinate synthase [Caldithrix sp.]